MRRVELTKAPESTELARDVPSPQPSGPPLLCAGMRLDFAMRARAAASGVSAVWINDALGEGIDPPAELDPTASSMALRAVERIFVAARRASQRGGQLEMGVLRDAQQAAGQLAVQIRQGARDSGEPPADPGGHHHALRVSVLGLSLGLALLAEPPDGDRDDERLNERLMLLGAGLLMHDIGKVAAPGRGAHAADSAAGDDVQHAIAGEALMPASLYPVQVRSVVRSHHEHWDGSGRPDHKAGNAIHLLARIAAVADGYERLTSGRAGGAAVPAHEAVRQIEDAAGTRFDPAVVAAFSDLVLPYPAGSPVTLPDGREGVVVRADRADRLRPLVRVAVGHGYEEIVADLTEQLSPALSHAGQSA